MSAVFYISRYSEQLLEIFESFKEEKPAYVEIISDEFSTNSTMNRLNKIFRDYICLPNYIEHLQQNDLGLEAARGYLSDVKEIISHYSGNLGILTKETFIVVILKTETWNTI